MRFRSIITIFPLISLLPTQLLSQETVDGMEIVDTEAWTEASKFKEQILKAHNEARLERDAPELTWDDDLAKAAKEWVEQCTWAHSGDPNGENLATNYASPNASVQAWIVEEKDYSSSDPGFSKKTGHFTQVVWKDTEQVGCAAKDCGHSDKEIEEDGPARGWFLACQYTPSGNVKGEFEENVDKLGESSVVRVGIGMGELGLMLLGLLVGLTGPVRA